MVRQWSVVVTTLLVTTTLVAGCSRSDDSSDQPSTRPTTLAQLDIAGIQVARVEFCDRVPKDAVRDVLGGEPEGRDAWGNGEIAPLDAGVDVGAVPGSPPPEEISDLRGDLMHELGCVWTRGGTATARAWVFGRPVDADFAATLVGQAGERKRCTAAPSSDFGSPSVLQTCTVAGGVQRVRRAGLLGDSWLTCEVAGPRSADPGSRLDAWCAAVVSALELSSG